MRNPTPVTISAIRIDSWSIWYPTLTDRAEPVPVNDPIHVNRSMTCFRPDSSTESMVKKIHEERRNESPTAPLPIVPMSFSLLSLEPKSPRNRNPARGNATIRGARLTIGIDAHSGKPGDRFTI